MKTKPPAKAKKPGPKKEIKRPANKKPRPKKYVEAKVPELPKVPTEQVEVTRTIPEPKEAQPAPKDVNVKLPLTFELPEGQTEDSFSKLVLTASEQLKIVIANIEAQRLKDKAAAEEAARVALRYKGVTLYKDPGIGLIRRMPYFFSEGDGNVYTKYQEMLSQERPKKEVKPVIKVEVIPTPAPVQKTHWYSWFTRLFGAE